MSSWKNHTDCIRAAARKIEVDDRVSLRYYYRIADDFLQEANIHRQMKNIVDLYIVLLKFSSLFTETIPFHRDYHASNQAEKSYYKKKLVLALDELERLKPEVQQRVNQINEDDAATHQRPVQNPRTAPSASHASLSDRSAPTRNASLHLEIKQVLNSRGSQGAAGQSYTSQNHVQSSTRMQAENLNYVPSAPSIEDLVIDDDPVHYYSTVSADHMGSSAASEEQSTSKPNEKDTATPPGSCSICFDAPVEGACVPCGHMAGCMSCLNEVKAKNWGCPVCRAKIQLVLRLYSV